jgi:hypothetical protein
MRASSTWLSHQGELIFRSTWQNNNKKKNQALPTKEERFIEIKKKAIAHFFSFLFLYSPLISKKRNGRTCVKASRQKTLTTPTSSDSSRIMYKKISLFAVCAVAVCASSIILRFPIFSFLLTHQSRVLLHASLAFIYFFILFFFSPSMSLCLLLYVSCAPWSSAAVVVWLPFDGAPFFTVLRPRGLPQCRLPCRSAVYIETPSIHPSSTRA